MKFTAYARQKQGTGASRRLRNTGKVPGIVYGGATEATVIELDHNALWFALKKEAFHASILEMEIDGKAIKVLLRDVQYHPYKPQVLHIDFQRVDAKTKLHMKVPLHFKGEDESSAVKVDKCLVQKILNDLEIVCFPGDLPEFIEVDLSTLTKGQTIKGSNLKMPKGVKVAVHGKVDPVILTATLPVVEEEVAPVAAPAADAKKDAKKKK